MSLPTENDVSRALAYLAQTDESYARLVARVKALEHQGKVTLAERFLGSTGTVAEREAQSKASTAYKRFVEDYENAIADKEVEAAKRKRAELTIEVWRSTNANRRAGQI
jgi:predicted transcriptional regulator